MKDITKFCELYYASSYMPVSAYTLSGERICAYSSYTQDFDVNLALIPRLIKFTQSPNIFTSESFGYYGIIRIEEMGYMIIIGPCYNTPINPDIIRGFIRECEIPPLYREDVAELLSSTPRISYHQFINVLQYMLFCLCDEMPPERNPIIPYDEIPPKEITSRHTNMSYENKETQTIHNSYNFEKQVLRIIEEGKPEMLKRFIEEYMQHESLTEGVLAYSPLRQAQNIFIGWTSMVGKKAAIDGGLDVEQAYSLIDVYIQECERLRTFEEIMQLQYNMMFDFASRVQKCQIPADVSPLVFSCIQFINNHVNEPIRIEDVAVHAGKSRSYLVDAFKKELGFNMGEYIIHCKLNAAKNLLLFSDKSMSEISNYLCFSSQSHFISVFKKIYGMTPRQFQIKQKPL